MKTHDGRHDHGRARGVSPRCPLLRLPIPIIQAGCAIGILNNLRMFFPVGIHRRLLKLFRGAVFRGGNTSRSNALPHLLLLKPRGRLRSLRGSPTEFVIPLFFLLLLQVSQWTVVVKSRREMRRGFLDTGGPIRNTLPQLSPESCAGRFRPLRSNTVGIIPWRKRVCAVGIPCGVKGGGGGRRGWGC